MPQVFDMAEVCLYYIPRGIIVVRVTVSVIPHGDPIRVWNETKFISEPLKVRVYYKSFDPF